MLVFFVVLLYDIIVKLKIIEEGMKDMKKVIAITFILICIFSMATVYASNTNAINEKMESQLVQIKDRELQSLEDYNKAYGSESYGFTAYMLNKVRIYSIPFCFVGIAVGAIYQYVIGIRRIDVRDRGFMLSIGFVTIFVICQVLPLIFAVVVKSWRG